MKTEAIFHCIGVCLIWKGSAKPETQIVHCLAKREGGGSHNFVFKKHPNHQTMSSKHDSLFDAIDLHPPPSKAERVVSPRRRRNYTHWDSDFWFNMHSSFPGSLIQSAAISVDRSGQSFGVCGPTAQALTMAKFLPLNGLIQLRQQLVRFREENKHFFQIF